MENSTVFSRRTLRHRARRRTTVTIPDRVGPHVKLVFAEMQRQNWRYEDVVEKSGVQRAALKAWRSKNKPGLESLEAVLGALGWDFVPIPRAKILPASLIEALTPIAAKHDQSMSATIGALIELVARIHDRADAAPLTAPSIDDVSAPLMSHSVST